ncbi:MAG: hypothetical protein A2Z96_06055 [Spirochaetes bacterium GWB1_48_6]|nr:MAG: hypothetical protein A2Z96_06055 [Spirochaetes bacterium GWB1_48_6]
MVSQYFYTTNSEKKPQESPVRTWSVKIIILAITVLILQSAFNFILAPQILITRVLIEGAGTISHEQVMKLAGLKVKEYYFSVDQNGIKDRLENSGLFKTADVQKVFPETLKIDLIRRKPVAVSLVPQGKYYLSLELDGEGIVCNILPAGGVSNLPVLSGVLFQDVKLGMRVPDSLGALMGDLASLQQTSQTLYLWISEIQVHKSRNQSFTMTVYPSVSSLKIRLGDRLDQRILKEAAVVADMLRKQGLDFQVQELDFRTDQIVLSTAED